MEGVPISLTGSGAVDCCGGLIPCRRHPLTTCATRLRTRRRRGRKARRRTNSAPRSRLLLNAEADHRSMIDAIGVVRRADVERRRAFEIVGAIAEGQL